MPPARPTPLTVTLAATRTVAGPLVRTLLLTLLGALVLLPAGHSAAAPVIGHPGAALAATAPPTTSPGDDGMLTLPPDSADDDQSPPTTNDFLDLNRDPSECIGNSLEKPGCGRAPVRSGDRGGAMQYAVFGLMTLGIAFIGWRIVIGARKNARARKV